MRAILDRPAVAGVIVGARLNLARHLADNARGFGFRLDVEDWARLNAAQAKSHDL